MKTVSAREANHNFSELLSRVERAEQILITKRNKPVALLSPYHPPRLTPERQAAIELAINVMAQGLPWGANAGGIEHSATANPRKVRQRGNSQGGNKGRRSPNNDRRVASGAA